MPSEITTFEQFRDKMIAVGYEEVVEKRWEAGATAPTHTHPFEANALVTQGEMWLTEHAGLAKHLLPGDRFNLQAHVKHEERYGDQGATLWVARRTG